VIAVRSTPVGGTVFRNRPTGLDGIAQACVLLLAYFALWTVLGRYWGLQHDAQHYALQALAKLHPAAFADDLFLRYRSQDEFTLFPQILAAAIHWFGLDAGAAVLTLLALAVWIAAAWAVARAVVSPTVAWLSLGLLLVVPGWYGSGKVFRTVEPFLSARTAVEALSLISLAFALRQRSAMALLVALVAASLHPIMALPAAAAAVALWLPWRDARAFWPTFAACLVIGGVAAAAILGQPRAAMVPAWLELVAARSGYLFPSTWSSADWQTNLVPLLTLLLSSEVLADVPRRLARCAFWIGSAGLVLAAIGDACSLTLLLQGQPWRWTWIASVASPLLLPMTLSQAWHSGNAGRAVGLLIAAGWLLLNWSSADTVLPIGASSLLLLCAFAIWMLRDRLQPTASRRLVAGATAAAAIAALGLILSIVAILRGRFEFGADPPCVEALTDILQFTGAAMLLVTLAWWATIYSRSVPGCALVGLAAATLIAGAGPTTVKAWTNTAYGEPARSKFAHWRSTIPAGAEVYWPDGLQETWFLLNRRSYLSRSQLAGVVFSEELAAEARRRAEAVSSLAPVGYWFLEKASGSDPEPRIDHTAIAVACRHGGPDYIVSGTDVGQSIGRVEWPIRGKAVFLYDCRVLATPQTEERR
jgi:hypothetical protein